MSDAMVNSMILCVMMYPFIFLMYFLVKNEATPKQKLWFGVTLDKEQQDKLHAEEVKKEYEKQMKHALWLMLLFPLPMFLIPWFSVAFMYWIVWMTLSVFIFFLPFAKANGKLKAKKWENGWTHEEEDDDAWVWGMVYYNPNDKHSMVDKRVGIGTTVNMATPVGKGTAAIGILGLLSMPVIGIWVMMLEFTPISLKVEDGQVIARHLNQDYAISAIRIENAQLLEELPKMSRNHGTSMEQLKKGSYHIKDVGDCEVFLNPQNSVFLMIETSDELYYFSGVDDEETKKVYEQLQKQ